MLACRMRRGDAGPEGAMDYLCSLCWVESAIAPCSALSSKASLAWAPGPPFRPHPPGIPIMPQLPAATPLLLPGTPGISPLFRTLIFGGPVWLSP